jgi:hypothetical protein
MGLYSSVTNEVDLDTTVYHGTVEVVGHVCLRGLDLTQQLLELVGLHFC